MTATTGHTNDERSAALSSDAAKAPLWATQQFGIVVLLIGLLILFRLLEPVFFDQQLILFPLSRDISLYIVVGLAQMAVLSVGHLNLAVGRMAAFGAMWMGICYDKFGLPLVMGALVGLLAGAAIGALTGWIIVRTGVSSFVVTLAMDFALLGLVPAVYAATTANAAYTTKPAGLDTLRSGSLADVCLGDACGPKFVPYMFAITLVTLVMVGFLYRRTRLGREVLLVGANVEAARLSGIPTGRRIMFVHALSGTLAALGGFMSAAITGSFKASIGGEFMLPSFLGPILGGTSLSGGGAPVVGSAIGSAVTLVIRKGLEVLGVGLEYLNIWLGAILLIAISSDRVRGYFADRRLGQ